MAKAKKSNETVVTFLLDKSGSMGPIKNDTIGAFNAYLSELQKEPAGMTFSFLQFDTNSVDTIHRNVPVGEALLLTPATYNPNGGTPLIDAAYKTIKAVEASIGDRRPKVVICIQTDGQENASRDHTWADLQDLIKEKTALGWQFNFMGCGIDAYAQGAQMGIAAINTMSYDRHDAAATRSAFAASAQNTVRFGAGLSATTAYSAPQRAAARDRFVPKDLTPNVVRPTSRSVAPTPKKSIVDDIKL